MCILPLLICGVASLPGWFTADGAAHKLDCAADPQGEQLAPVQPNLSVACMSAEQLYLNCP